LSKQTVCAYSFYYKIILYYKKLVINRDITTRVNAHNAITESEINKQTNKQTYLVTEKIREQQMSK